MSRDPWRDGGYHVPAGPHRKFDLLTWAIAIMTFLVVGGVIFALIYAFNWA